MLRKMATDEFPYPATLSDLTDFEEALAGSLIALDVETAFSEAAL